MNIADSRHFSPLVKDYLTAFETSPIREFFNLPPFERGERLKQLAKEVTERASTEPARNNRQVLVEELRNQHKACGILTDAVAKNLELLAKPTTLAVVTGQQVGILGGPLYTLYKAISAIGLARELRSALGDQYDIAPIFWQETEDHDFDEAAHYGILDKDGSFAELHYNANTANKRQPVGAMQLDNESLDALWKQLRSSLQQTEFTESVFELFERCYSPETTFAEAQAKLLGYFTANEGLLILNANTRALKTIGRSLFEKEIRSTPELQNIIQSQTAKLSASYRTQLDPSAVNLFIIEEGKRYKLEKDKDGFRYDDKHIESQELFRILESEPERISPNVALRPLLQDLLLPTIAYVAGPGEIAYLAQLKDAYRWAGIPMPLVSPRFSATLIEERVAKVAAKASMSAEVMIDSGSPLIEKLTATDAEPAIETAFDTAATHIESKLESLRPIVEAADSTLGGALTALKGKLLTPLKDFGSKTLAAERRKSATLRSQLERTFSALLPGGKLQERQLGLIYYVNKYGLDFAEKLQVAILGAKASPEHHLLEVNRIMSGELPSSDSR